MSFSTTPKGADTSAPAQPSPAQAARERAIAKFTQGGAPEAPPQREAVPNPSQVSPEELGAIQPPSEPLETAPERQDSTIEESSETPSTEAPKKAEEPLSSQYAVLARKEKALRAKAQAQDSAYQQREAALAAREAAIKAKESEYQTGYIPKDRLTSDPWGTLSEAGVTYDQVTQAAVEHESVSPQARAHFAKLNAKIAELEKANEIVRQSQAEQQTQQYKQAVAQIRSDTLSLVTKDPSFETIHATNSVDDVVELIERTFKEENVLMTVEEACKAVEDHLVEEAIKIAKLKKIQSRLNPPVAPATPAKQSQDPASKQPQTMKTLTNAVGSSRQLSAKERAILAFKGELK